METKVCKTCNLELSLDNYHKGRGNKGGLRPDCRKCRNKYNRKYAKEKLGMLDYFVVYYLPSCHYVGITNQPKARMYDHERFGRDTTGWKVLFCSEDRHEARLIENRFHDMGCEGLNLNC